MNHLAAGLALALLLAPASGAADGQDKGSFDKESPRPLWLTDLSRVIEETSIPKTGAEVPPGDAKGKKEKTKESSLSGKRYLFVHVRPAVQLREPTVFNNVDIVKASYGSWAFIDVELDKDNPYLKSWEVKGAPTCLACDRYGNAFLRSTSLTIDAVRGLLKGLPEAVGAFETKLRASHASALEALKADEAKGVKALVDIVLLGKVGYPEVGSALEKLSELGDAAIAKGELAESVSVEKGIEYLDGVAKLYRVTPPGVRAEIRIARLENVRGSVQAALQRLQRIMKLDARFLEKELEAAAALVAEISMQGMARIQAALAGDKPAAKKDLATLAREYAGTEAGGRATQEAKKLD